MVDQISRNKEQLTAICKNHGVRSLFLFGSAAKGEFKENKSDLDFVVEFDTTVDPINYADNFFSLLDSLKKLFNKEVDLLTSRSLKNKILISEIESSKVQLYAA